MPASPASKKSKSSDDKSSSTSRRSMIPGVSLKTPDTVADHRTTTTTNNRPNSQHTESEKASASNFVNHTKQSSVPPSKLKQPGFSSSPTASPPSISPSTSTQPSPKLSPRQQPSNTTSSSSSSSSSSSHPACASTLPLSPTLLSSIATHQQHAEFELDNVIAQTIALLNTQSQFTHTVSDADALAARGLVRSEVDKLEGTEAERRRSELLARAQLESAADGYRRSSLQFRQNKPHSVTSSSDNGDDIDPDEQHSSANHEQFHHTRTSPSPNDVPMDNADSIIHQLQAQLASAQDAENTVKSILSATQRELKQAEDIIAETKSKEASAKGKHNKSGIDDQQMIKLEQQLQQSQSTLDKLQIRIVDLETALNMSSQRVIELERALIFAQQSHAEQLTALATNHGTEVDSITSRADMLPSSSRESELSKTRLSDVESQLREWRLLARSWQRHVQSIDTQLFRYRIIAVLTILILLCTLLGDRIRQNYWYTELYDGSS